LEATEVLTNLLIALLLLMLFVGGPIVIFGVVPEVFRKYAGKNLPVSIGALALIAVFTTFHTFFWWKGREWWVALIPLAGCSVLLYLMFWLMSENVTGMSTLRRSLFELSIYVILAANAGLGPILAPDTFPGLTRLRASRSAAEMERVAVALEAYFLDHNEYPPAIEPRGRLLPTSPDGSVVSYGFAPPMLTTPVAYLESLPVDPFAENRPHRKLTYRYATNGAGCWILTSNGPDRDADIRIRLYPVPGKGDCSPGRIFQCFSWYGGGIYNPDRGPRQGGDIVVTGP